MDLPTKQILFLERLQDFSAYKMVDLYGNGYTTLDWEKIRTLTWRQNPMVQRANPAATARLEDLAFFGETMDKGVGFPANTSGDSGHRPPNPKPKPRPKPRPKPKLRPEPRSKPFHGRGMQPRRGGHHPMGEPRRPQPMPRPRDDEPQPRTQELVQRHEDEYMRRVRLSTLQKVVKKFDGSGDPHDHVASFK